MPCGSRHDGACDAMDRRETGADRMCAPSIAPGALRQRCRLSDAAHLTLPEGAAAVTHQALMTELQKKSTAWLSPLIGARKLLYLDLPGHFNIGDHLIMQGTERYFVEKKADVIGRRVLFQKLPPIDRDVVILCHGGGNFGDLYPNIQLYRERIVREYPDNRIVFLPQSIHFKDNDRLGSAAKAMILHADLHIGVRDPRSLEIALSMGLKANLVPDMAHHLYPIEHDIEHSKGVLRHFREDREAIDCRDVKSDFDWSEVVNAKYLRNKWSKRLLSGSRFFSNQSVLSSAIRQWIDNSRILCGDACAHYARNDTIETDRLHGHLLACLMNLRSVVHDNNYGKVHAYVRNWTAESPLVTLVHS